MNFKLIVFTFIASFFFLSSAVAYPWVQFREDSKENNIGIASHVSYFVKGEITVFSGISLNYDNSKIKMDIGYEYSFLEEMSYIRISDLAVIFPFFLDNWKVSLGFRNVLWSEADRYWNFGLWQARFLLDAFRPIQMGLPGLYFTKEGSTSVTFLISAFYLPDSIPYPKLTNHLFVSKNPFFSNDFTGVYWDIGELELFQFNRLLKPIIALQIKHALANSSTSFSYAYKPVNQFQYFIYFDSINFSKSRGSNKFAINDFDFAVVSHHLATLEGELPINDTLSLHGSILYEKPEKRKYGQRWISNPFESHLIFSVFAYFIENLGNTTQSLFTIGYTKTLESNSIRKVTKDFEDTFGRSFNWMHALSTSMEYKNKQILKGFLFRFRFNYAFDNGFYAIALENHLNLTPNVQAYLSGDVLFRFSEKKLEVDSSSIKKYQDLSRLLTGVKYVF